MFEITPYSVAVFVHVLSAIALTGHALAAPVQHRLIRGSTSTTDLLRWLELARLETRFNPAIALVLLATGVYLGSYGWWAMPWFYVALAVWVASSLLATRVIQPSAARLAQAAATAGPGPVPPAVDALRRSQAWPLASASMLGMDLGLLWVMFNKPSLAASLGVTVAAIALCCGARLVGSRRMGEVGRSVDAPTRELARG